MVPRAAAAERSGALEGILEVGSQGKPKAQMAQMDTINSVECFWQVLIWMEQPSISTDPFISMN